MSILSVVAVAAVPHPAELISGTDKCATFYGRTFAKARRRLQQKYNELSCGTLGSKLLASARSKMEAKVIDASSGRIALD